MKKQKTRELEKQDKIFWRTLAIGFFFLFILAFFIAIAFQNQIIELKQQVQYYYEQVPEVINGNLYIGYEDGVRVGYHRDYIDESIWYRCARDCEVIPIIGKTEYIRSICDSSLENCEVIE